MGKSEPLTPEDQGKVVSILDHAITTFPLFIRSFCVTPSEASSLYCTSATMREHHRRAYVGLFKAPWAEKSLCELLNTHLENVQLALSQRDACEGGV